MKVQLQLPLMKVQVGDKVYCNWGAMHPTEERTILKIENGRIWCERGLTMPISHLRDMNEKYLSPIGVYLL